MTTTASFSDIKDSQEELLTQATELLYLLFSAVKNCPRCMDELKKNAGVCETPDPTDLTTVRQRPPRKEVIDHEYKERSSK